MKTEKIKGYEREGPKTHKMHSCKGCTHCQGVYDDHWYALHCLHPDREGDKTLVGYMDEYFPFPKEFRCPVNRKKDKGIIRRA
jgi:hypothetical protein